MNEKLFCLEKLCSDVISLCKDTGQWILREMEEIDQKDVKSKGLHDFVTHVDKSAEKQLTKGLHKLLPFDVGFLAEENTVNREDKKYTWIVDPLDGTTNFIHGVPCFSISIALCEEGKTLLGIVYEINRDEMFYSWGNGKAYLNGREINVSQSNTLNDSLLATGFPYFDYSRLEKYMEVFMYCLRNSRGVRRFGSAAVDLAYVACGRFDGFFEYSLKPWDVAAGAFIVQQAGGMVADFSGSNDYIFGKEIVATNNLIYNEFIDVIKNVFD